MLAVFLSAAVAAFAALFLGQATLRLAGAREWNWLAPAVGLAIAAVVATPTMHVPGRATTMAILFGLLTIAAAVWCLRSPPHRPPLSGLLAPLPVVLLVITPFLAAGRGGILGVTVNNDMAVHLLWLEGYVSAAVSTASPLPADYPIGPHALAALLTDGLGIHAELGFSGLTMALPVINAWTALAVARRASWFGKAVAATVVGLPFLVAAYYGEGAFKEVAQAGFVLAVVLSLSGCGPKLGRGRWVPLALLLGGMVAVYSPGALLWPLVLVGVWLLGLLAIQARRHGLGEVPAIVRRELPALGIGLAVLFVLLLSQAERMWHFIALRGGTGIAVDNIGNLVGPLPGWEALGTWNNPDFRLPASAEFTGGIWSIFVLALIVCGTVWAFRRGRWLLPVAAAATMGIWAISDGSQSPYVAAKALVIASPLLLLVAVLPLVDRRSEGRPRWPWLVVPLLGLALFLRVGRDDLRALRWSPVAPADAARQLQTFRPLIDGKQTLFLGEDEFIGWQLAGVPVTPVALASLPVLPLRPQKDWRDGEAIDFDSVPASTLDDFEWVVGYRDAAASVPPPQFRLVDETADYRLWRRNGPVRERAILAEGEWAGAVLDCDAKEGREILAAGGTAAVRRPPIVAPLTGIPAGGTATTRIVLPAGTWELQAPYASPYPVEVSAPGLRTTLPASLARTGPRLPIGRVTIRQPGPLTISFHVEDTALAPPTAGSTFTKVIATRVGDAERVVPIRRACGRYVDWYRPGPS